MSICLSKLPPGQYFHHTNHITFICTITTITTFTITTTTTSTDLAEWKAYNSIRVICSVSAWVG